MTILAGVMSSPKFDPQHPKYRCACSLIHSLLGTKIIAICLIASTSLYMIDAIYRGKLDVQSLLITVAILCVFVTLAAGAFSQRKRLLIPFIVVQSALICLLSIAFAFLSATVFASYFREDWSWTETYDNSANQLALLALIDVAIAISMGIHCWLLSVVVRLYRFLSDRERIMATPIKTPGFDGSLKHVN